MTCPGSGDFEYADVIVDAPGTVSAPSAVNEPENAINGVHGDPASGSTDVFSRGVSTDPANNYIVLRFSERRIVDGPGADFVVFENAFETRGGNFMDPVIVAASNDGVTWVDFPHDYVGADEQSYEADPAMWVGFAGVSPVSYDSDAPECPDPLAQEQGGDRFDLAEAGLDAARYLRLTTAASVTNPDSGTVYPKALLSDGFDLDGIYAAETAPD